MLTVASRTKCVLGLVLILNCKNLSLVQKRKSALIYPGVPRAVDGWTGAGGSLVHSRTSHHSFRWCEVSSEEGELNTR